MYLCSPLKSGMRVFKFGGASVKDASAVRNVKQVLSTQGTEEILVVVSAMGKTTNSLEELAKACFNKSENRYEIYSRIKQFHDDIIKDLLKDSSSHAYDDIENLFIELECELESIPDENFDRIYDQIVSYGEIFSSRIVSAFLNENGIKNRWMDARNFIITNNTYREGKVNWPLTSSLIGNKLRPIVKKQMVLTQGFIGRNLDNFTVTLGREGSDYSAAIFAYGLDASDVTIWKDVAGVMNADPKKFPDAIKFNAISYPGAIEMAYYGATVIHPKTIQPLQHKHIPLYVKSFLDPSASGTKVGVEKKEEDKLSTIISKGNQDLISMSSKDFSFIAEENLGKIFQTLAELKIRVNLMQNSAISFSVCIDHDENKINSLKKLLEHDYSLEIFSGVELLTIANNKEGSMVQYLGNRNLLIEQKNHSTLQLVVN